MEKITVKHELEKAVNIEQFRYESGRRIKNKPYYRLLDDGVLLFDFIKKDTDAEELEELIKKGKIFIVV